MFALTVAFPADIRRLSLAGNIVLNATTHLVRFLSAKVFGFRFTELPSVQWLVLCPLVGLVLSLSLGPHIPPVYHGASLCSVACALSTWGLSLVIVFGIAFP